MVDPVLVVQPRWFDGDRALPAKAISIIEAGPASTEWLDPEIVSLTPLGADVATVWRLAFRTQPLQLDVWARSDVELDDLCARLDTALNRGAAGVGVTNVDPAASGVILALADGWTPCVGDFVFDSTLREPAPDSVQVGEWRATMRGRVVVTLLISATNAKIARINLNQRLRTVDPIDSAETPETTVITSAS